MQIVVDNLYPCTRIFRVFYDNWANFGLSLCRFLYVKHIFFI